MKKTSSTDKVVGKLSDAEKVDILKKREAIFRRRNVPEHQRAGLPKTSNQLEIIKEVDEATNVLRRKYGLEDFHMTEENIHILPRETWDSTDTDAFFLVEEQRILIRDTPRNIRFAKKVFRAMINAKAYGALQKLTDTGEIAEYRTGLSLRSRSSVEIFSRNAKHREYFQDLNETLAEELTVRYIKSQSGNPLFKEDIKETLHAQAFAKEWGLKELLNKNIYDVWFTKKTALCNYVSFTHEDERRSLQALIADLFVKNSCNDKFAEIDEVLDVFVRAMFTGHMFELAHLIDKKYPPTKAVYGRGTLRKIGVPYGYEGIKLRNE